MISANMRKGGDISFIPRELMKVRSAIDFGYVDKRFYGSLVAVIGHTIGKHLNIGVDSEVEESAKAIEADTRIKISGPIVMDMCPRCGQPAIIRQEGCERCTSCTYAQC